MHEIWQYSKDITWWAHKTELPGDNRGRWPSSYWLLWCVLVNLSRFGPWTLLHSPQVQTSVPPVSLLTKYSHVSVYWLFNALELINNIICILTLRFSHAWFNEEYLLLFKWKWTDCWSVIQIITFTSTRIFFRIISYNCL